MDHFELQTPATAQEKYFRSKSGNDRGGWPVEQHTDLDIEDENFDSRSRQPYSGSTKTGHQSLGAKSQFALVDPPPVRTREDRTFRGGTIGAWRREALACLVFLSALFAMVATARYFNNKTLPHWPLHISINAVYSVFANIFEASLLYVVISVILQTQWHWFAQRKRSLYDIVRFNDASRGAFGAFKLLATKRLQQRLTAFAAVIAILTVGTDTFVQQLVGYKDCTVNLSGNATIPRTNMFNPLMSHIEAGPWDYPNTQEMTALVSGLLSSPADVDFDCSSGNCTYTTVYSTLGYCSSCADISDQLKFDFLNGNCTIHNCTIISSLPSGLSVDSSPIVSNGAYGSIDLMAMSGTGRLNSEYEILIGRNYYTETNLDPSAVYRRIDCDNTAPNASWLCRGYGAASCTFSACVRTYNATVTAGRLDETLIETSPKDVQWEYDAESNNAMAAVIDTHCIASDEANQLRAANYTWNSTTRYIVYNLTTWNPFGSNNTFGGWIPAPNSSFPQSMAIHNCVYLLSPFFVAGFDMFFMNQSVFAGTLSAIIEEGSVLALFNGSQILQKFYNNSYNSLEYIDGLFQNAATTFTNHIRENGNTNYSKLAQGVISHYATCVEVHWPWIALPAALSGCTLILLFLAIIETMRFDAPIWKGSPLAVIFQGPGGLGWLRNHRDSSFSSFGHEGLLSKEAMEKTAKGIHVQLQDEEPNVRLVMVEHD